MRTIQQEFLQGLGRDGCTIVKVDSRRQFFPPIMQGRRLTILFGGVKKKFWLSSNYKKNYSTFFYEKNVILLICIVKFKIRVKKILINFI